MIDILVPVLSRPQNAQPLVDSIRANTTRDSYIIHFLCSQGDLEEIAACRETIGLGSPIYLWALESNLTGDYARKINHGYATGVLPFVFAAADDIEFTPGWDTEILRVAEETGAGMVGSNDDANPLVKRGRHSTHTLFSREYIDTIGATFFDGPGVVYHEGYHHQWVDTEAVKAAMDRGQWAFARRSVVRHHHPFFDKSVKMDSTYKKALGDASHDSALYRQRLQQWARQRRATVL